MNPHLSSGIFSQRYWPGIDPIPGDGDASIDDCWAVADLMAVHAIAPWVSLPGMHDYRAAAGNPDTYGQTPGSIDDSVKAIKALWPELGALISVSKNQWTWATFKTRMTKDRVASLSVMSASLPAHHQYGFLGTHRVAVALVDSGWEIANPLAPPHSRWKSIGGAELKRAVDAYPYDNVFCVLMPSVAAAFKTHPLYQP